MNSGRDVMLQFEWTDDEIEAAYRALHGTGVDSSETGGESEPSPTHECQACGEQTREQTPFTRLELWCETCDCIRWFRRL